MTPPNSSRYHGQATRKAHLGMLIFSVIIAGSFLVVAAITPGHDSTVLTFWRFLTATIIFGLMLSAPQWVVLSGIGVTLLAVWLLQLDAVSGPMWSE